MKTYYDILELKFDCSDDEIRSQYLELVKKYHPDKYMDNPLNKLAEEKLQEINEAYEVLKDKEKKKSYDKMLLTGEFQKIFNKNIDDYFTNLENLIFKKSDNIDEKEEVLKLIEVLLERSNNTKYFENNSAEILSIIFRAYFKLEEYQLCVDTYYKMLSEHKNFLINASVYYYLALSLEKNKQYLRAIFFYKSSNDLFVKCNIDEYSEEINNHINDCYIELGKIEYKKNIRED